MRVLLAVRGALKLSSPVLPLFLFFFFNDTATTEIYTLSLHDALPIFAHYIYSAKELQALRKGGVQRIYVGNVTTGEHKLRSEEHTSELQSHVNLVCRLLLEKKNKKNHTLTASTNTLTRAVHDYIYTKL